VQASAPVQRSKRGPVAKILVRCEVMIACIGTNSGTGEEWSDKENALTGAEAQACKRALSCVGLGRYLYDTDGEWIELDQHGVPKKIPKLPRWATPKGWLAGLRPKPRRNSGLRAISLRDFSLHLHALDLISERPGGDSRLKGLHKIQNHVNDSLTADRSIDHGMVNRAVRPLDVEILLDEIDAFSINDIY